MKRITVLVVLAFLICLSLPGWAQDPVKSPKRGAADGYCPPPRFQIFDAPRPYGGLLMVDTQTGESYQRVIMNTPQGIQIRWLKLDRMVAPKPGETILWD
jgi:hypothetical protein